MKDYADQPGWDKMRETWESLLNPMTDKVLSYRPKPKSKAAKKRARKQRKKKRD
jgi:hypothetical protein